MAVVSSVINLESRLLGWYGDVERMEAERTSAKNCVALIGTSRKKSSRIETSIEVEQILIVLWRWSRAGLSAVEVPEWVNPGRRVGKSGKKRINHLSTNVDRNYIYRPSTYRAVNTLRLGYTNQSVKSYGVPVRERYGSTLLPATREQHDQNCTQSH